jgi:hypothetical protein
MEASRREQMVAGDMLFSRIAGDKPQAADIEGELGMRHALSLFLAKQTATKRCKPAHCPAETVDFTRGAKKHPEACKSQGG